LTLPRRAAVVDLRSEEAQHCQEAGAKFAIRLSKTARQPGMASQPRGSACEKACEKATTEGAMACVRHRRPADLPNRQIRPITAAARDLFRERRHRLREMPLSTRADPGSLAEGQRAGIQAILWRASPAPATASEVRAAALSAPLIIDLEAAPLVDISRRDW